ncbi:hypothetical protein [Arachidicoccus terrestris]|uniref:hypothetical protein n=1 Tax=Arachidicoccus terrestris TaxID=2875539 RepID=UPI001CC388A2|nr:hypothetical protein [Arachidicoccus terrestris]UAY55080.1 hypothetical protein K9M52_16855 [Arachidicoccus terrestris]
MKCLFLALMAVGLSACNQQNDNTAYLQSQIDSLRVNSYKPGFGEFMSSIQIHHDKLWFAGQNMNWELADFEMSEIRESLDDIKKYCTDRPEANSIDMIEQPLQNLDNAILHKDKEAFVKHYRVLTATCNSCHQKTAHGFNVITIPTAPPFTNQLFKMQNEK